MKHPPKTSPSSTADLVTLSETVGVGREDLPRADRLATQEQIRLAIASYIARIAELEAHIHVQDKEAAADAAYHNGRIAQLERDNSELGLREAALRAELDAGGFDWQQRTIEGLRAGMDELRARIADLEEALVAILRGAKAYATAYTALNKRRT